MKESKLQITQSLVDSIFMEPGGIRDMEQCQHIVEEVNAHFNVRLSLSEAERFWSWRSSQFDATWLSIVYKDEICAWFKRFVVEHKENEDDAE